MSYKKSIFALLLFSQITMAQGEAGSLFLAINPGARANGMGAVSYTHLTLPTKA